MIETLPKHPYGFRPITSHHKSSPARSRAKIDDDVSFSQVQCSKNVQGPLPLVAFRLYLVKPTERICERVERAQRQKGQSGTNKKQGESENRPAMRFVARHGCYRLTGSLSEMMTTSMSLARSMTLCAGSPENARDHAFRRGRVRKIWVT